jgi:hypothetical protein
MSKVPPASTPTTGPIRPEVTAERTATQKRVNELAAKFESASRTAAPESPADRSISSGPARPDIAARTARAATPLSVSPTEIQEFNELLDQLADQLADPKVSLRQIDQPTVDRLIALDVRIPPDQNQASIRRILSFLHAPTKITADALRKGPTLEALDAFAGLLAVTRAGGAEKDDAQLKLLAKNFKAIHSEVLKMQNGPALAKQMVQGVFERAKEAPYQRFLIDFVAPKL